MDHTSEPSLDDHALLESLFFNEMMMLDSAHAGSLAEALPTSSSSMPAPTMDVATEQALLRDIGVEEMPPPPAAHTWVQDSTLPEPPPIPSPPSGDLLEAQGAPTFSQRPSPSKIGHGGGIKHSVQARAQPSQPLHVSSHSTMPAHFQYQHQAPQQQPLSTDLSSFHPSNPAGLPQAMASAEYPGQASMQQQTPQVAGLPHPNARPPEQRAEQLVGQFAALASRLGINLPGNVLSSLTATAAANERNNGMATASTAAAAANALNPSLSSNIPEMGESNRESTRNGQSKGGLVKKNKLSKAPLSPVASSSSDEEISRSIPTVEQLRKTAEAAVEAVSRKRSSDNLLREASAGEKGGAGGNNADGSKPVYSKRRKKPTLADCETKLARLRQENAMLKRQLEQVSNKAQRIDNEKAEASDKFQGLLENGVSAHELSRAVQEFTDLYSDYGRRRQQELTFHLDQLSRLVNPTNFTKMGLWTLAQSSSNPKRNPIAGILQKELQITPQQGRKILDQRETIRALCNNLKECQLLLGELKTQCAKKTQLFHDRMKKCQEILTTKQVVKLIVWINENTQILDNVCPGWGTEHIHPSSG